MLMAMLMVGASSTVNTVFIPNVWTSIWHAILLRSLQFIWLTRHCDWSCGERAKKRKYEQTTNQLACKLNNWCCVPHTELFHRRDQVNKWMIVWCLMCILYSAIFFLFLLTCQTKQEVIHMRCFDVLSKNWLLRTIVASQTVMLIKPAYRE